MASATKKRRSAKCKTCNKIIRFPAGWSVGASVRRHYWRHHPEIMKGQR